MATIRKNTRQGLGKLLQTRLVTVNSEMLYRVSSACHTLELSNYGDSSVFFGTSGVTASSGGFIASLGSKVWDNIRNDFQLYLSSGSSGISNFVTGQEYN